MSDQKDEQIAKLSAQAWAADKRAIAAERERDSSRRERDQLRAELADAKLRADLLEKSTCGLNDDCKELRAELATRTEERDRLEHEVLNLKAFSGQLRAELEKARAEIAAERNAWGGCLDEFRALYLTDPPAMRLAIEELYTRITRMPWPASSGYLRHDAPVSGEAAEACAALNAAATVAAPVARPDGAVVHPSPAAALEERVARLERDNALLREWLGWSKWMDKQP